MSKNIELDFVVTVTNGVVTEWYSDGGIVINGETRSYVEPDGSEDVLDGQDGYAETAVQWWKAGNWHGKPCLMYDGIQREFVRLDDPTNEQKEVAKSMSAFVWDDKTVPFSEKLPIPPLYRFFENSYPDGWWEGNYHPKMVGGKEDQKVFFKHYSQESEGKNLRFFAFSGPEANVLQAEYERLYKDKEMYQFLLGSYESRHLCGWNPIRKTLQLLQLNTLAEFCYLLYIER